MKAQIINNKIVSLGNIVSDDAVEVPEAIINQFPEPYCLHGATVEVENNEVVSAIPSEAMVALFRANKCDEIDNKTQDIIFRGFSYNNIRFSLSITAQINWSNIPHLPDFLFPIPIQGQDNSVYQLTLAEKMNFYLSAVAGKNTPLQQGTALKAQVNALTDLNEIKSFVDPRE